MSRAHVLIVDDDGALLYSAQRVLASTYEVLALRSPENVLEQAQAFDPALAIIDIRMGEMDGFELSSKLRELCPGMDVIFMTGVVHELDAQIIRSIREKAFYFIRKPFDRDVLITLVERCLDVRRLNAENAAHLKRLENEMAAARAFQVGLQPPEYGRLQRLSIATHMEPCEDMSGDFIDYVDAGRGRVTMMLADVSGHGVSAAMLVGIVKAAFRATREDGFEPLAVARRIRNAIRPFDEDRFVSLFCARIARDDRTLEWVNAGHPKAFLWDSERNMSELALSGTVISPALPDMDWEQHRTHIEPGSGMLLYTDGLLEARAEGAGELFGLKRLRDVLAGSELSGMELLNAIMGAVNAHSGGRPADDDRTLLTVSLD
ncbi:MAG: sigma-B regulation protein RsbU (phosphoserine phosphatase) [Pseudohongiellaceae bacterium]|jgi:sigma-B regulation protein RsbU (phosphoserine phosphatase)